MASETDGQTLILLTEIRDHFAQENALCQRDMRLAVEEREYGKATELKGAAMAFSTAAIMVMDVMDSLREKGAENGNKTDQ